MKLVLLGMQVGHVANPTFGGTMQLGHVASHCSHKFPIMQYKLPIHYNLNNAI